MRGLRPQSLAQGFPPENPTRMGFLRDLSLKRVLKGGALEIHKIRMRAEPSTAKE